MQCVCFSVCECCLSFSLSFYLFVCVGVCVCHAQNNSPLCLSWQGALYRRLRVATWVFRIRFGKRIYICIRIAYSYVQRIRIRILFILISLSVFLDIESRLHFAKRISS